MAKQAAAERALAAKQAELAQLHADLDALADRAQVMARRSRRDFACTVAGLTHAIDFGTTTSAIVVCRPDGITVPVTSSPTADALEIPTAILVRNANSVVVGFQAVRMLATGLTVSGPISSATSARQIVRWSAGSP